jgi:hypothetical protein
MTRHCTRCNAEVEDAGGYCLLGHPLRLNMETSSLDELKREVEAAFESAQDEVRDTLTPLLEQVEATTVPQHEAQAVMAAAVATMPARYAAPAIEQVTAPAEPASTVSARPRRQTPPPPPPKAPKTKFEALWEGMEGGKPLDQSDPINAFAPPPRMDWGPQRSGRKGRGLRRLRPSNA